MPVCPGAIPGAGGAGSRAGLHPELEPAEPAAPSD